MRRPSPTYNMPLHALGKVLLIFSLASPCLSAAHAPRNILHLVADDMRPQLGIYGHDYMKTPNLDELGRTGVVFDHAYTQLLRCGCAFCFVCRKRAYMYGLRNIFSKFYVATCFLDQFGVFIGLYFAG